MTRLITRGEQLARKQWIPIYPPDLSNLDRLDRGLPPETFGEPVKRNTVSAAPFWFGLAASTILLMGALVLGIAGAM